METNHLKVLAIDDNRGDLAALEAVLAGALPGATLLTFPDGLQGIEAALAQDPDLILLDIAIPGMDACAVCRQLKQDERLRAIPVLFLTGDRAERGNRAKALDAGADGFLSRPLDDLELVAQIRTMAKIRSANRLERLEKQELLALVAERTRIFEQELAERKRAEEALRQGNERLLLATVAGGVGIWDLDLVTNVLTWDEQMFRLYGLAPDNFGGAYESWKASVHPDDVRRSEAELQMALRGEKEFDTEFRVVWPSGSIHHLRARARVHRDTGGRPTKLIGTNYDITERKLAEENLREIEARIRQSEKMEAVGRLAGGIAHDFNNVLGAIMGFTSMSLGRAEEGSVLERNLLNIQKAATRAKRLVQQIQTFTRHGSPQRSVAAIRPIVTEALDLLRASLPSSISIEADLQDTKPVSADPTQIHEMLLNLAANAVHAMGSKGTLTVRLFGSRLDRGAYGRTGAIAPGEYAVLEVADTGCGMDAATVARACEPFFTTKAVGEGTGMGLSVVLGIVQSHGGDLQVDSVPGEGSTFRIYLPVPEEPEPSGAREDAQASISGTERVLFVDDEPMLVDLGEKMLSTLGYRVTCMSNGLDALTLLQEKGAEIDMLVTDQTMPGMTGVELARAALSIKEYLPVVLCTGYSSEIDRESAAAIGIRRFVMKPYGIREIGTVIREVLDSARKE